MKDGMIQLESGAANQPRTLFKPGSWLAKIDFINHLILFNNVLITVLSEKQGGKTSFNTLLQNNLDQQIKSLAITIKAPCDGPALIQSIATQLHLNYDDFTDLSSIVAQINERKAHVLVILDDAQDLPEALVKDAMIAVKRQGDFGFFHLCFVSDYSIVATLNALAVDQLNNLVHTIELGALNESETRTYVLQRAMTTHLINKPLTDAQYKQFYLMTKGNLSKINTGLESFVYNCLTPKKKNNYGNYKRAGLGVTAAMVVGFSYLYIDLFHNTTPQKVESEISSELPQITEHMTIKKQNTTEAEQLVSVIPSWQESSTRQLVAFVLPKMQRLDKEDRLDSDEDFQVNRVAAEDKEVVVPTVKANVEVPHSQTVVIASKEKVKTVLQTKRTTLANVIKPKLPLKSVLAQNKTIKPEVTKTNSNQFTIQLLASHKISDIHRYRKSNKILANAKMMHFKNEKGTWYVLTLGQYDSRQQAQKKVSQLPPQLAKLNPWIRPTSGLNAIG